MKIVNSTGKRISEQLALSMLSDVIRFASLAQKAILLHSQEEYQQCVIDMAELAKGLEPSGV